VILEGDRYLQIQENLLEVSARIGGALASAGRDPQSLTLIAVTKTYPARDAQILYQLGLRNFGENRDEEGAQKAEQLPPDVIWHFQGQIQSRKIPSIARWAKYVHSLDELSHATKFLQQPALPEFFLQVNLESDRPDRGGVPVSGLDRFISELPTQIYARCIGLMAVAPIAQVPAEVFETMATVSQKIRLTHPGISGLSIGMSGDFEAAIAHGATHIRIGSSILGVRSPLA
jgi:pyridoxal phosphate enzyme (YggS family)